MKLHKTLILVPIAFLSAGSVLFASEQENTVADAACCAVEPPSLSKQELSEDSIYHLAGTWLDRDGKEMQLRDLQGRPQVVAMLYTYCEYTCPRIVADLKRVEQALSETVRDQVGFLAVSIDPDRDTPARLTSFAEQYDLPAGRWTLLHGNPDNILELAAVLGFRYKQVDAQTFSHSNTITVLDSQGVIVHQHETLGTEVSEIVAAVEVLTRDNVARAD